MLSAGYYMHVNLPWWKDGISDLKAVLFLAFSTKFGLARVKLSLAASE
jgi:hypothetical protein